jgi:hypothetical protein
MLYQASGSLYRFVPEYLHYLSYDSCANNIVPQK